MADEVVERIGNFHLSDEEEDVIPIDDAVLPLKRGGYVTLGNGVKYWVDYKFERLNNFCHYCGSLLHEQGECGVKSSDEKNGILNVGRFGQWMKANSGGRQQTGLKWETNGGRGDGENFRRASSPVFGSNGEEIFKLIGDKESARIEEPKSSSGLIEIKDSDWISLNGKEIRMGELIPNSLGFHSGTGEAKGGPLDLDKNPGLGSIGPGLVFQQSEAEIQVGANCDRGEPFGPRTSCAFCGDWDVT
ncbi:hypothetical protein RHMOL_Rhmol10G0239000 [Rhododendron molle]|uniref:Uncharacterized protein n=1 Tax=Rhododendron molle TaxID=49168 RepID=A0ACC0M5N9_RHOML|nr:hypothetical protein RHMOL_Rhmol10G0239000 [Rhododendron molle]